MKPFSTACFLCLLFFATNAAAQGEWWLGVDGGYLFAADDRNADFGWSAALRVANQVDPRWRVGFELRRLGFDSEPERTDESEGTVQVTFVNPQPLWRPYLIVAAGAVGIDDALDGDDSGLVIEAGVGGSWALAGDGLRFQVEARYRRDFVDRSVDVGGEAHLTAGITWRFA